MAKKGAILLVEDEAKIAEVVKTYLQRDGYEVHWAETGNKALSLFKGDYSLVILDLMLPDIDGEDIARAIREHSEIPIIMLTAKSAEEDRIHGLGIGADDYVVKPFSPRELVARVNALLRRAGRAPGILSFNGGALVLDPSSHEAKKNGIPIALTPTEFRLLLTLAERPGMVLSRENLITSVAGYDFEGYERTIDAHIKNLRHKIEDDPREPVFIKTVYGLGYKFEAKRDA